MTADSAAVIGALLGLLLNLEAGPHRKPKSSIRTPLAPWHGRESSEKSSARLLSSLLMPETYLAAISSCVEP